MPTTIEQLELEVQSSSTSAVAGIDALSASLSKLKNAVRGGVGLTSVANQVRNLDTALKSMDSSGADKIDKLASSLEKLKGLGSLKISSSIGNQLQNIGSAAASLTGVDFSAMEKLGTALQPLNNLNASGLKSTINALNKLPKLADTLDNMDMTKFTSQIQQLSTALAPLTNQLNAVTAAFNRLPTNIQRAITVTNRISQENNKAANSYMNLYAKIKMAMGVVRTGARVIASWITQSNQYIEDLNLFTASMGKYAEEAQNYAEAVSEALGIDPGEFMRNQGVFNTIISGFGVASDKAYLMSKNLTQLGYDISSFFNISFEDAMQKLQSGISGELEPLRRLGYDLSVARLQEEALALGIEKKVSAMTQAEKSQLRYYAIMTQVTTAQGDMARTLNAPANQLRVLQAQVTQCARALGNIFIPALNAVLPYAIALAKIVRMLANSIASLFGFKLPEVDYSGISAGASAVGDLADNAGDASDGLGKAGKAAKKLKNALLGIDELNVLSKDDSSSGSGSGSGAGIGGGDLGIDLPTYDFLGGAITSKVDEIVQMIKDAMWEITAVISGFLLAIGTILVVTGANIPLGLGLMAVGAVGLAASVMANWNGMSERLAKVLTLVTGVLGGFLLAIGAFLVFSGVNVPLGAGLMVAGAAALGTAVALNWDTLTNKLKGVTTKILAIAGAAALAIGIILCFTGVGIPLGVGLILSGAAALGTAVAINWETIKEKIKGVFTKIKSMAGSLGKLAIGLMLCLTGVGIPLGLALIADGVKDFATGKPVSWGSMVSGIKEALGNISDEWNKFKKKVKNSKPVQFLAEVKNNASEWWDNVKGWWSDKTKDGLSLETGVKLVKDGWSSVKNWIGNIPAVKQGVGLLKSGWSTVKNWIGNIPTVDQAVALAKSGWQTVKGWIGNIPGVSQAVSLAKSGWNSVREWVGNIPVVSQGISLLKSGWTTVKNWVGNIPTLSQAINLIKSGWQTVKGWIGNIPTLSQAISLIKNGWTTVKNWIGNIPVLSQGISLLKSGWTTVKNWIGNIPTLSQGISLLKSGWSTVKNWIGSLPVIAQGISLFKSGWTTIKNWIGSHTVGVGISLWKNGWSSISSFVGTSVSVGISLFKSGWTSIKKFFGLANGGIVGANGGVKMFASGGIITPNMWKAMPKYAGGTNRAHGSMFVAGESGAELVGHVNGTTEVLNRFQLASVMHSSIVSGMAQFSGYWQSMSRDIVTCANGIINAVVVSTAGINDNLVLASASGYDPYNSLAQTVYEDSKKSYDGAYSDDSWSRNMREFYHEYVEPTLKEIATDTKRQADKKEQTIVKVGNRTINDAVTTQKEANGFSFTE